MKAQPLIEVNGVRTPCLPEEATHLRLLFPPGTGQIDGYPLVLPVMITGARQGSGKWTWNGDCELPTLRPSVLSTCGDLFRCHSWITEGDAIFLSDCSHDFKNQTLPLIDLP